MDLDLADRRTLIKSWLATLHGPELTVRPRLTGPLPSWRSLVSTAVAWHVAYALFAYAGSVVIARTGTGGTAQDVQDAGLVGQAVVTLVLWWGGVALTSALWWAQVRQLRQVRRVRGR